MRRSTWMKFAAVMCGLFLCQTGVLAAQVTVSGKAVPLPVRPAFTETAPGTEGETGETGTTVVKLKKFTLYGLAGPDLVAVSYDGNRYGFVDRTEFQMLLPKIQLGELPSLTSDATLSVGSGGTDVVSLQQQLINLGFLTGGADGVYGNGTAGAVSAFQEANGLTATGTADAITRLVAAALAGGSLDQKIKTEYPAVYSVEDKFTSIMEDASSSLEPFVNPEWNFTYDKVEGIGSIDNGVPAGTPAVDSPAIDQIVLNTAFKVVVKRNDTEGTVDIIPAMTIDSTGACRPYVQSVVYIADNEICEIKDAVNTGGVDGITLFEHAYVPLTKDAASFLTEHDNISVRIKGRNNSYDYVMDVNRDSLGVFLTAVDKILP